MNVKVKLTSKKDEAKGTKTFIFKKPGGFEYQAGQYCFFTVPELKFPDQRGNTRLFTLSSSPTENFLAFTSRMRTESGFKNTLDSLAMGVEINMRGPEGTFTLDNSDSPQIMLAGGIGITPFRSIIKYISDKSLQVPIHLIYSNSLPEEIAFRQELEEISSKYPNIKITLTVSRPEDSQEEWQGERGRIDEKLILKHTTSYILPTYWICGPPAMVEVLEGTLRTLKVSSEQVKVERFTGY